MQTLEITPQKLVKKFDLIDLGETSYDWHTQTRLMRDGLIVVASTCLGADSGTKSQCGQMFSDDSDTD